MFRVLLRQVIGQPVRYSSRFMTSSNVAVQCRLQAQHLKSISPVIPSYINRAYSTGTEIDKSPDSQTSQSAKKSTEGTTSRSKEPTNFERKILVWTGRYKTVNEVPDLVSDAALTTSKSKFRIYVNLFMGACTLLAAIGMVIVGKRRTKRGESLSKQNIERHPEVYDKMIKGNAER